MKNVMILAALVLSATAVAGASSLERNADAAAKSCLSSAKEQGYEFVSQTNVISACFAGGFVVEVDYFKVPRCNGPQCESIRLASEHVATVGFACTDEVAWAECYVEEEPVFCPTVYAPVCGFDGVTYSNSCFADVAGVEWTLGECGVNNEF